MSESLNSVVLLLKKWVCPSLTPAHNAKKGSPSLDMLLECACVSEGFKIYGTLHFGSSSVELSVT